METLEYKLSKKAVWIPLGLSLLLALFWPKWWKTVYRTFIAKERIIVKNSGIEYVKSSVTGKGENFPFDKIAQISFNQNFLGYGSIIITNVSGLRTTISYIDNANTVGSELLNAREKVEKLQKADDAALLASTIVAAQNANK
jgi:hypothetical protein